MSASRKQHEPAPGDPRAVQVSCADCGARFWRYKGKSRRYCADCASARQAQAAGQMSARSGPVYELAVRKQLLFWLGEARRLGVTIDGTGGK